MSARGGIVVTGTEVLTGIIADRNGPWLSERMRAVGIEPAHIVVVGDRRADMLAALDLMARERLDLVVTSGGLGPTADDLTTEVVAGFQGREMVLDPALEERIAEILRPLAERYPDLDPGAIAEGNRKQAIVPEGAIVLEPVGTAPGVVVPPAQGRDGPLVVVLPGPPRELQPMWDAAVETEPFRAAAGRMRPLSRRIMRLFGIPESEIALTLRELEAAGMDLLPLEITTCLRRAEIEIATSFEPGSEDAYAAFEAGVAERHRDTLFSLDGSTVDDQVAALLAERGWTIATAESCTGGLLAARLTERAGASAYVLGGVVAYADAAKTALAGVEAGLVRAHGAVSEEVARALAGGARERVGADVGVGVTGIAGPDGGSEEKPVGLVWVSVAGPGGAGLTRRVHLPGGRVDIRDRSVVVAMHLVRRLALGESDAEAAGAA